LKILSKKTQTFLIDVQTKTSDTETLTQQIREHTIKLDSELKQSQSQMDMDDNKKNSDCTVTKKIETKKKTGTKKEIGHKKESSHKKEN